MSAIIFMNLSMRNMKEVHLQKIEELHLIILELSKNQKVNQEKIDLAEEFKDNFKASKLVLNNEILSLQHEFLEIISKK